MQRLEFSGAVRPIYGSLGVKRLTRRLIPVLPDSLSQWRVTQLYIALYTNTVKISDPSYRTTKVNFNSFVPRGGSIFRIKNYGFQLCLQTIIL